MAVRTGTMAGVERFRSVACTADTDHLEQVYQLSAMGVLVDGCMQYVLAYDEQTGMIAEDLVHFFETDESFVSRFISDNARRAEAPGPHPELTLAGQLTHLVFSRHYRSPEGTDLVVDLSDSVCEALDKLTLVTFPAHR